MAATGYRVSGLSLERDLEIVVLCALCGGWWGWVRCVCVSVSVSVVWWCVGGGGVGGMKGGREKRGGGWWGGGMLVLCEFALSGEEYGWNVTSAE